MQTNNNIVNTESEVTHLSPPPPDYCFLSISVSREFEWHAYISSKATFLILLANLKGFYFFLSNIHIKNCVEDFKDFVGVGVFHKWFRKFYKV